MELNQWSALPSKYIEANNTFCSSTIGLSSKNIFHFFSHPLGSSPLKRGNSILVMLWDWGTWSIPFLGSCEAPTMWSFWNPFPQLQFCSLCTHHTLDASLRCDSHDAFLHCGIPGWVFHCPPLLPPLGVVGKMTGFFPLSFNKFVNASMLAERVLTWFEIAITWFLISSTCPSTWVRTAELPRKLTQNYSFPPLKIGNLIRFQNQDCRRLEFGVVFDYWTGFFF